jgi:hypothetical protein
LGGLAPEYVKAFVAAPLEEAAIAKAGGVPLLKNAVRFSENAAKSKNPITRAVTSGASDAVKTALGDTAKAVSEIPSKGIKGAKEDLKANLKNDVPSAFVTGGIKGLTTVPQGKNAEKPDSKSFWGKVQHSGKDVGRDISKAVNKFPEKGPKAFVGMGNKIVGDVKHGFGIRSKGGTAHGNKSERRRKMSSH